MKFIVLFVLAVLAVVGVEVDNNRIKAEYSVETLWPERVAHQQKMASYDKSQGEFEAQVLEKMHASVFENHIVYRTIDINSVRNKTAEMALESKVVGMMQANGVADVASRVDTMHDNNVKAQAIGVMDTVSKTIEGVINDPSTFIPKAEETGQKLMHMIASAAK